MISPDKLLYKALYWGPLFVAVISLVAGAVLVRRDLDFKLTAGSWVRAEPDVRVGDKSTSDEPLISSPQSPSPKEPHPAVDPDRRIAKMMKERLLLEQKRRGYGLAGLSGRAFGEASLPSRMPGDVAVGLITSFQQRIAAETLGQRSGVFAQTDSRIQASGIELAALRGLQLATLHQGREIGQGGTLAENGMAAQMALTQSGRKTIISEEFGAALAAGGVPWARARLSSRAYGGDAGRDFVARETASEFGGVPLLVRAGLANSLQQAGRMKVKAHLYELGSRLSLKAAADGVTGYQMLGQAVTAFATRELLTANLFEAESLGSIAGQKLAVALGPLGAVGRLNELPSSAQNCPQRFHAAVQWIRAKRVANINDIIKPISARDKSLPGRWLFPLGKVKMRRQCLRYKVYYSGRRKCLKWSKPQKVTGAAFLSEGEQRFVRAAATYVSSRGQDPKLKPRSPSYWVINRVARDLKIYTSQPAHPAICTGVPRMLDYFEGNLGKVRKQANEFAMLEQLTDGLIAERLAAFNDRLEAMNRETFAAREEAGEISATGSVTKVGRTGFQLRRALGAEEKNAALMALDFTEQLYGAAAILPKGAEARKDPLTAFRHIRSVISDEAGRLPPALLTQFRGLIGLLEAVYYVNRLNRHYQDLSIYLFGSLDGLRAAYEANCTCELAAMPPVER